MLSVLPKMGDDSKTDPRDEFEKLKQMQKDLAEVSAEANRINAHSAILGLKQMDCSVLDAAAEQMNPFVELFSITSDLDASIVAWMETLLNDLPMDLSATVDGIYSKLSILADHFEKSRLKVGICSPSSLLHSYTLSHINSSSFSSFAILLTFP